MNQTESVEAHMNVERSPRNNHCVVGDMGGAMARGDLERATTPLQAKADPIEVLIMEMPALISPATSRFCPLAPSTNYGNYMDRQRRSHAYLSYNVLHRPCDLQHKKK
jgi:hypothetical protein